MLIGGGGIGLLGLPWLGCCGAPRLELPWLAYWYDGGRPSGCCPPGFIVANEVEDADGAAGAGELEFCDCDVAVELTDVAADEVPFVVGAG